MKNFLTTLSLLVLFVITGFTQDAALHAKVAKMIELSGAKTNFDMAIDQMLDLQKMQFSDALSDEFFEEFQKEAKKDGFSKIVDKLIPIYMEHHTEEEIDGMIAFYESEIGKKMVEKTPLIMQEAMQVGQAWGAEMGAEIYQKLEKERNRVKEKRN